VEEKTDRGKKNPTIGGAKRKPFQDYISQSHTILPTAQGKKYIQMHLEEIADRGRTLRDLNFLPEDAQRKIELEIAWEYELSQLPTFYSQVKEIVNRIYPGRK